jgi:hypothetical protein
MSLALAILLLVLNITVVIGALVTRPNPNIVRVIQTGD